MLLRKFVSVMHRPSRDVMFRDSTYLNDLNNEFHNLPVAWSMMFHDNGLTRVLTQIYEPEVQKHLDHITAKYAYEMGLEKARRERDGVTVETYEEQIESYPESFVEEHRKLGRKLVKSISTRPNRDILFGNGKIVADYNNENHDLPIDVEVSYSDDMLMRTKIISYDPILDSHLDVMREKYKESLGLEGKRQWEEGVRTTMINITNPDNPIFYLDQLDLK